MPRPAVDPEISRFVERYLQASALSTASSVERQRRDYEDLVRRFSYPRPSAIRSSDRHVTGRHGDIPLRYYHHGRGDERALILFLHGGGFILGSLDSHDDVCAEICAATGYDLVSVDYRLSPEHTHPVHLDDVEDAFLQLQHENTVVVGVSAGGTLAAGLAHRRRAGPRRPAGQVLIYPSLGGECLDLDSYRENAQAPLLSTADILFYRAARCAHGELPLDDAEFYPLAADDFGGCPPTVATSADVDPLRDDARVYVEKLLAAGVAARWINESGLVHDYLRARHTSRAAGAAFQRICDAVRELGGIG